MASALSFRGKRALAPMVRVSTLPMRLLAKHYGADLVWGPEIVDKRIIASRRVVNDLLGTVDYVCTKTNTVNFRCLPSEKPYLVFQIGTADADLALQAALTVRQDVAAVDVNCGCPKPFSTHGGMGAALLSDPDKLCSILHNLVQNADIPITAKIRILPDQEQTLSLVRRLVDTGIAALTIHCRTKNERPRDPGHWDAWEHIAAHIGEQIPIVANGDIFNGDDIDRALRITNVHSVMIARAAQCNPSIFRHPLPLSSIHDEVIPQYIRYSILYDNTYQNTKYVLMQMIPDCAHDVRGEVVRSARGLREIAAAWGLAEEYDAAKVDREQRKAVLLSSTAGIKASKSIARSVLIDLEKAQLENSGILNTLTSIDTEVIHCVEQSSAPSSPPISNKRKQEAADMA